MLLLNMNYKFSTQNVFKKHDYNEIKKLKYSRRC